MGPVRRAFRAKQIAVCVSVAFSMAGYWQFSFAGNNLPVGNCFDDGSSASLRVVAGSAMSGDTVDMSALVCSNITLEAGSCAITLPYGITLQGPGADKLTIHGNQCPILKSTSSEQLTINDLTLSDGVAYSATGNVKGGCIYSAGDVFASRSLITNCAANAPDGYAYGGGIFTSGTANLNITSVTNSKVTASAFAYGGGLHALNLVMTYSTLSG
ncbi:MAG TPA: hypothetical protein VHW73_02080, partial [Rudaea sp.]|nr:hypothetical protein [Rudaea sp.]